MNRADEASLARDLLVHASQHLGRETTMQVWTKIGAGETDIVIRDLLTSDLFENHSLPAETADRLEIWLQGYRGCDYEPQLRRLVERAVVVG